MPKVLSEEEISSFRTRLCDVATRQFAESGYEKVSMRTLAEELSVSRMTPYRYFNDKAEMFAAVRANGFRQLIDQTEAAMAAQAEPIVRLETLAAMYFEFAEKHAHLYYLMFEMPHKSEMEYPELTEQLGRLQSVLIKASTIGVDAGIIKQDATLASQLFWAGMHGVVTLHLSGKLQSDASYSELGKEMVATLYRGMTVRG